MLRRLFALTATLLISAACSDAPTSPPLADAGDAEFSSQAKAELFAGLELQNPGRQLPPGLSLSPGAVTYEGILVDGHSQEFAVKYGSLNEPLDWDYWSFCAVEGAEIAIEVHRTTSAMDPAAGIFSGTTPVADDIWPFWTGNAYLTPLVWGDDELRGVEIPHGVGGSYGDPRMETVAPATGLYTLVVFDYWGDGPPDANGEVPYDIEAWGLGGGLPTPTAALTPVPDKSLKSKKGHFTVEFGCTDNCGGSVTTTATLNGIPVENGQVVQLQLKSKKSKKSDKGDKSQKSQKSLKLKDTSFVLEVTCSSSTGGVSTTTVEPVFAEKSVKSMKDKTS